MPLDKVIFCAYFKYITKQVTLRWYFDFKNMSPSKTSIVWENSVSLTIPNSQGAIAKIENSTAHIDARDEKICILNHELPL